MKTEQPVLPTGIHPASQPAPAKKPLDLWREAERAEQESVIEKQIALLNAKLGLAEVKGSEDYARSLVAIVKSFPQGIPFPLVRTAFDDEKALVKARDELKAAGKITFDDTKRSVVLFPVTVDEKQEEVATK